MFAVMVQVVQNDILNLVQRDVFRDADIDLRRHIHRLQDAVVINHTGDISLAGRMRAGRQFLTLVILLTNLQQVSA